MLQIGNIVIRNKVVLAPMAGVTDHAFRMICRRMGAGMVYTEFVSANGIIRGNDKTLRMMHFSEEERPIGVQIFGESADALARSSATIQKTVQPDLIDLNFGCPVPKITKKGAGSAILKDLPRMEEIARAVERRWISPLPPKFAPCGFFHVLIHLKHPRYWMRPES